MPLKRNILKTKLLEVGSNEVQRTLRALPQKQGKINFKETEVFMDGQRLGRVKKEYEPFLGSLLNPKIKLKPTGGYSQLLDENKKVIRTYRSFDELSNYEKEMLSLCIYSYRQLNYGCNLEVIDDYIGSETLMDL